MIAWNLWTGVPRVKLWEAVALVLEIDPNSLELLPHGWMAGGNGREIDPFFVPRSFPSKEKCRAFEEALGFAGRATSYSGPIHVLSTPFVGMSMQKADVALAEVVTFFVGCQWPDIPAPLLALQSVTGRTDQAEPPRPTAAAEPKKSPGRTLATPELAEAFDGIDGVTAEQWRKRLGDLRNHEWMKPARATTGTAPNPATWWPLKFAELLRNRGASDDSLNRAFLNVAALKPWLHEWQEARRERNAFGQ